MVIDRQEEWGSQWAGESGEVSARNEVLANQRQKAGTGNGRHCERGQVVMQSMDDGQDVCCRNGDECRSNALSVAAKIGNERVRAYLCTCIHYLRIK